MGEYSQADRKFRVDTPLGTDVLLLERFEGEEAISQPFRFTLDLVSEDPAIDAAALLRKPASVSMELPDGGTRTIHGRVRRFEQLGREAGEGLVSYRAEVVPWLWFLSLASDCRIFQNKSVPDILEQVFKDFGFSDFRANLTGSYEPREYCVQYRETYLDFVSRLMEEEGIFYFFEHAEDKHTLVLADAPSAVKPCPAQAKARFVPQAGPEMHEDVVLGVAVEHSARTGKVTLRDFNYLTPDTSLSSEVKGEAKEEHYDYPGGYATRAQGDRYARIALAAREAEGEQLHGTGTCRAFQAGFRFGLVEHYRADLNAQWQLMRVAHVGTSGGFGTGRGADDADYSNSFTCIPHGVPFHPRATTPRPVVAGTQTAVVVGPAGEEIFPDKYSRVKVQFHWDREGKKDQDSSCWVRVSTAWAGKGFGFLQIPRIGDEVVVAFEEGDPDRPIIVGRVYNAAAMPAWALPANQTQSGVRTRSSKGGAASNCNELRFEDKKGS
jgi:type VI secretion system secreted protein VgrG